MMPPAVSVALLIWLCVSGGLVALETWVGNLYLLMLALAAGLLAGLLWLGVVPTHDVFTQLVWFSIFSGISLAVVRPLCVKWFLQNAPSQASNMDALIGQRVQILEPVSATQVGRVKILKTGETWTALLHDTASVEVCLAKDTLGTVQGLEGARLLILPIE
ncbi:MAG: NfeD family protein [Vampirovibrionales bacterium]